MINRGNWKDVLAFPPLYQWSGFLLATLGVMLGAAAFDFISAAGTQSVGSRAANALQWAGQLVLAALCCGFVLWLCIRLVKGGDVAPEPKESVLWSASVIVIIVTAVRLLR